MTYPKLPNKHVHEALFKPIDFVKYQKWNGKFPKKYIITYQTSVLNYFKRKYRPKKIELYSLLTIYRYKDIGFIKMKGVGSPHSAAILEELIALGGREFLNIGTAGGLQHEGIFLCNKSLRDEGTSYHYVSHGDYSYPDKKLTKRFGNFIKKQGLEYEEAASWTIDAPYRETKKEIQKYKRQGIATVEMEASALFVVARYRKVKIASAFVVSDVLIKKWEPKFHSFNVKKSLNKLINAGMECLK